MSKSNNVMTITTPILVIKHLLEDVWNLFSTLMIRLIETLNMILVYLKKICATTLISLLL